MIFEKTIAAVVSAAAIGAAVAVAVVSASFALYAVLLPHLGAAGSAACLSGVFALLALVVGLIAARKAEGRRQQQASDAHDGEGLVSRLIELAKDKPLIAAGAAVAAGIFALRNPAVLTAIISAFVAGNNTPPPKR